MEDGDSPGCLNRLNEAPVSRVSHEGCRKETLHLVIKTSSALSLRKKSFWALLNAAFTHMLMIPSQIFTDVAPDHSGTYISPRPNVQTGHTSLVPVLRSMLFSCIVFFLSSVIPC